MLVETGVYNKAHGEPKYKPDYICANILEAVNTALEKEGQMEIDAKRLKHIEQLETRAKAAEKGRERKRNEAIEGECCNFLHAVTLKAL